MSDHRPSKVPEVDPVTFEAIEHRLRHHGNSPTFVPEEISCPSCATLIAVREVRRNGGGRG